MAIRKERGRWLQEPVALLIFEGDRPVSPVEEWMAAARAAIVLDILEKAARVETIDRRLLVTNRRWLADEAARLNLAEVVWEEPEEPPHGSRRNPWEYHLGRALAAVILKLELPNVIYCGGGACPLVTEEELYEIGRRLKEEKHLVLTNNPFSADLVAFSPGDAIGQIELPEADNPLPMLLHHQAGLRLVQLPRTLGINFDIDTPTDLMVLAVHPGAGVRTREALSRLPLELSRFEKAKELLLNREAQALVYGRVGAPLFGYLDEKTRCRLRLISEERGMKSSGRDERGEVVSLLGLLWQNTSPQRFFSALADLADVAFLDTRVLFAHLFGRVKRSDRFYSDLGQPEKIEDPRVRLFTEAALEAPIPVILGGHSLVTGGLWALLDAAYATQAAGSTVTADGKGRFESGTGRIQFAPAVYPLSPWQE
ncbi:MAG: hypothetical protein IMX00_05050 [Limnochordales bacterium]|nr:hypothetical protein [Limnochordales bacterium]